MRAYELMVIFDADVADATIQGHLKTLISETVESDGGSVAKVDNWGKRRFAYEINHMNEGYYSVIMFEGDPDLENMLDRSLSLLDSVVRHKIFRKTA